MHLGMSKSKNSTSLYVLKSTYDKGFHSTKIVEKLGTVDELAAKLNGEDPIEWAKRHIAELNKLEREEKREITAKYSPTKQLNKDERRTFNGGYLFLQQVYNELGFPAICKDIKKRHGLDYNLDAILSRIVYSRILYPTSSLSYLESAKLLIEQPEFTTEQLSDAIKVLSEETNFIQKKLYGNTQRILGHNTSVLYYDATICLYASAGRKDTYAPVIPMEIYYDGNLIPLGYSINPEHLQEVPMTAIEEELKFVYSNSKVISTSDGGVISTASPEFKNWGIQNSYIMSLPYDRLYDEDRAQAADPEGWLCSDKEGTFNIEHLSTEDEASHPSRFYYKEFISERGITPKRTLITYTLFRFNVSRLEHEAYLMEKGTPSIYNNDTATAGPEGIQAFVTNLIEMPAVDVINTAFLRRDIHRGYAMLPMEESDSTSGVSQSERINAHFITCYSAMLVYTVLLKKLNMAFRSSEVQLQLQGMNFMAVKGEGYVPLYMRTDLTDLIHDTAGFRTDYHIIRKHMMDKLVKGKY